MKLNLKLVKILKLRKYQLLFLLSIILGIFIYFIVFNQEEKTLVMDSTVIGNVLKARQMNTSFDYKKSNIFYKKALEIDPYNDNLLEEYLFFSVSNGDFEQSFILSQKVVIKSPTHFLANLILITKSLKNGDLENAITHLQTLNLEEGTLNDILLKILLSLNAYAQGNIDEFQNLNHTIATLNPDFYQYLYGIVALYYQDMDIAKAQLFNLNNNHRNIDSVIYYSKILYDQDEKEGIAYFNDYLNDNFLSEDEIRLYINSYPKITLAKILSEAMLHIANFMSSELNQNLLTSDSFILTNIALMLDKSNYGAGLSVGGFYESIGNYDGALNIYENIPDNIYYSRLSSSYTVELLQDLNKDNEALKFLERQILQSSNNPTSFLAKGQIYHKQGKYKKAISAYEHALYISEKNNYLLTLWLSHYFMGISYDKLGDWDKAERSLLIANSIDDSDPVLMNYLAYSWINRDYNIAEALNLLQRALEIEPNNSSFLDSYAWGLFKEGKYDEALEISQKANDINSYDSVLVDHLGDILWQKKDVKGAISFWNMAINLSSEKSFINSIEKKLSGILPEYLNEDYKKEVEASSDFINAARAN